MTKANTLKRGDTPRLKRILLVLAVVVAALAAASAVSTISSVPRLFKRNAELKVRGYYMGEFEFKLVALQYYLNEGSYIKAYTALRRIAKEMETTEGLLKMPEGAAPKEQMAFLLDRQDPTTGAFMDPRYPFFTYIAPTLNVVSALHDLAQQTGEPLKLKYPLRFLDQIRRPEQLRAYLHSLLYLDDRWAVKVGPGPYGPGVSELAYIDVLERDGLYRFPDDWKDALRQWFYETQDPATGLWGFRVGNPGKWRQAPSANSTFHVLHLVLDERGGNRSEKYPLRYAGPLARGLVTLLDKPIPDAPAKQHDWSLNQSQGARMITRLWGHLSESEREQARKAMQAYLTLRYRFFRPADGGFSLYTSATRADVDGTGNGISLLRATGSLPGTWERDRLWGKAIAAVPAPVRAKVNRWEEATLPPAAQAQSLRVYKNAPPTGDTYDDANLVQIIYPGNSLVLDVMDLRQRIAGFITASGQGFGNWVSKESLREPLDLLRREARAVPVSRDGLDLAQIGRDHPDVRRFYVIGYDCFQVPVFRAEFAGPGGP